MKESKRDKKEKIFELNHTKMEENRNKEEEKMFTTYTMCSSEIIMRPERLIGTK